MDNPSTHRAIERALIVHAHPEPRSFSTAQAKATADALQARGVGTTLVDLYAEDWDPVLTRDQFSDVGPYFKPQSAQIAAIAQGTLQDPVRSHLTLLQDADLLVLSFPLWWFSMPAILKGWMDRVFVMGATFGGEHGIFEQGAMRGKKAMLLLTTGGAEAAFTPDPVDGYGDLDTFLFHIHRGMLEFCGYEVLPPAVTHGPVRLDDRARSAALEAASCHVSDALNS